MTRTAPIITEPEPESPQPARPRRLPGLRLALFAGLPLWLACPAISLWPLAWIAVAPLIIGVTRAVRLRQAVWRGYMFGWVYLGAVWYWTGLTIRAWTHSDIGWLAWFGLTMILALFYALWGGAAWWLSRKTEGLQRILAISAAWVVVEWLRTLGSLTMPWAQLSYTQYRCLPLLQIAELTGAYGVTFLIVMFNAALAEWWRDRSSTINRRHVAVCAGIVALTCLYGVIRLSTAETGNVIKVAAMQPNFKVFSDLDTIRDLNVFNALTETTVLENPGHIALYVWPESAAPVDALHDYHTYDALRAISEKYDAALTTGSRVMDAGTRSEYNSSVLFLQNGSTPQRYDKVQLVPFGEFIPFRNLLPAVLDSNFQFPPNDVSPGTNLAPLKFATAAGIRVAMGPFICYESMYPIYARSMTNAGANLLVTQSNDDWFQSRSAMEQHLSAVVLRAIENRRSVVRSTTTGITCIIDSRGRLLGQAPIGEPASVVRNIHLETMCTLYTRLGDWFVLACGFYLLTIVSRETVSRRSNRKSKVVETTS